MGIVKFLHFYGQAAGTSGGPVTGHLSLVTGRRKGGVARSVQHPLRHRSDVIRHTLLEINFLQIDFEISKPVSMNQLIS